MAEAFVLFSTIIAVGWVPILLKFFRAWRTRKNPVSLAICGIILLSIYTNVITVAVYAYDGNPSIALIVTHVFSALICGNFYLAFLWSNRKFPNARTTPSK